MNYTYPISNTVNNKVDTFSLTREVNLTDITIKLNSISIIGTDVVLNFADTLPSTQKEDYLDGAISAHQGIPIEQPQKVENVVPVGGPKLLNKGFKFTADAGVTTVFEYTFVDDIKVAQGFMYTMAHHIHDSITLELVYPLPAPNGTVIHAYAENYPVNPSGTTIIQNSAITEQNLKGLIMRVTYTSNGVASVLCNCGIDGRLAE